MKHKRLVTVLAAVLILALGIGVGAYAASNLGTQSNPLVAKSYLDQTVTPQLQQEFQTKLDEQVRLLESKISSSSSGLDFKAITLNNGQSLKASAGCELVLRAGTASAIGVLSDVTEGKQVASGAALSANHLYMALNDGEGLSAGSSVTVLVRGAYTVS